MSEQKTEQASAQRKQKARKDGDGVRSRELVSALALLAGVLGLGVSAKAFAESWSAVYANSLALGFAMTMAPIDTDALVKDIARLLLPGLLPLGLVLASCFAASLFAGTAQSGGISFHPEALSLKIDRLSPATNIGHLFSMRSAARLAKSLIPASIMVWFGYRALLGLLGPMPVMSFARLPAMLAASYGLMLDAGWVMLGWSALDYAIEWRSWEQRLKMSKQEMRDESKEAMGNPQMRGKIRQLQRAMSKRKRRADVSRASVIITNPTHYAVALQFDFETMQAPTVLAKGKNLHALEIRREAQSAGVPMVENPPLARSLYKVVEPGQSIPYELYQTVAAILAYLYRQQVEQRVREQKDAEERAARRSGRGAGGDGSSTAAGFGASGRSPGRVAGQMDMGGSGSMEAGGR